MLSTSGARSVSLSPAGRAHSVEPDGGAHNSSGGLLGILIKFPEKGEFQKMRSKFAAAGAALAAFALVAVAVAAAAKPNFAGTWTLDATKSACGQRGCNAETMTIKQDGDKLDVERKLTTQQGDRTTNDSYVADGKEGEFTMQMMGNSQKGKRTVKWSSDGSALEIKETASFQTPDGNSVSVESTSKWTLSGDGKTLTIEQTRNSPRGTQTTKRVFNKQ